MNGIDFLADTNFLIYVLEGRQEVEIFTGFSFAISFVTEIELLGKRGITKNEKVVIQELLDACLIIDLNATIKAKAIELKQQRKIKLPDSVIASTALYTNLPLLTADRGFDDIPNLEAMIFEIS